MRSLLVLSPHLRVSPSRRPRVTASPRLPFSLSPLLPFSSSPCLRVLFLSLRLCVSAVIFSTAISSQTSLGSLEVSGRVRIDGKQEKLTRKRFYLIRGGLAEHKALIDRLANAVIEPRDCFYSRVNASPEFICWLKAEDCQSPYCRDITEEDIARVPEFRTAFEKGTKQFRGRRTIAADWLTTNLPAHLASGFYLQRRHITETLLGDVKPLQSSMTDTVTVKAIFIDIPLTTGTVTEKFVVTNILPIEFGGKSYLWACEVEIGSAKPASMRLLVPEGDKPVKNCQVWVKELPVCNTGPCDTK